MPVPFVRSITTNQKSPSQHHSHSSRTQKQALDIWGKASSYIRARRSSRRKLTPLEEWEHWTAMNMAGQSISPDSMRSITQKYGGIHCIAGVGAHAIILQLHKKQYCQPLDSYYAIKVFQLDTRKAKCVLGEFGVVSQPRHINIITSFELFALDTAGTLYACCMEYCAGGDLHSLIIASDSLRPTEADCLFKQLVRGVDYLHGMGISHRNLKPENLLLMYRGCLKICDFDAAEHFRCEGGEQAHISTERRGSAPSISPEQYLEEGFDPRDAGVWAAAIIYIAMRTGRNVWKAATSRDERFEEFAWKRAMGKRSSVVELVTLSLFFLSRIKN